MIKIQNISVREENNTYHVEVKIDGFCIRFKDKLSEISSSIYFLGNTVVYDSDSLYEIDTLTRELKKEISIENELQKEESRKEDALVNRVMKILEET